MELPDSDALPIVLVHGYGTTPSSMRPIADELVRRLGRPVRAVALPSRNRGPLDDMVSSLGEAIGQVRRRTGLDHVDIVGHSRGGIVARVWAQLSGGEPFTRRVITIASFNGGVPITGAPAAWLQRHVTPNLSELLVDGELMRALRAGAADPVWNDRLVAIGTDGFDGIVAPPSAARIEGHPWHAMDTGRAIGPISRFGHWRLLRDPTTHDLVIAALA